MHLFSVLSVTLWFHHNASQAQLEPLATAPAGAI